MRIKKVSQTTPTQAQIINETSDSTTDAYSASYVNKAVASISKVQNTAAYSLVDGQTHYITLFTAAALTSAGFNAGDAIAINTNVLSNLGNSVGDLTLTLRMNSSTTARIRQSVNTSHQWVMTTPVLLIYTWDGESPIELGFNCTVGTPQQNAFIEHETVITKTNL